MRAAALVERHLIEVDQALTIVRSAVASKLDWSALARLVKDETRKGNEIASLIHELRLDRNEMVLMLYDEDDDVDAAAELQSKRDAQDDNGDGNNDFDDDDEAKQLLAARAAGESTAVDRRPGKLCAFPSSLLFCVVQIVSILHVVVSNSAR